MKKVLGLDLGTTSIGWAVVNEKESDGERSEIVKLGVRVVPLTTDEMQNFEKGQAITTNQERTLNRGARRSLQRYKLRRSELLKLLKEHGFVQEGTSLSEEGKGTTHETLQLRAKAANEKITLEEFARVLLAINKKRGYKSNRKANNDDEDGTLIDGMEVAKKLQDAKKTPGQYGFELLSEGKKHLPEFYRSDLQNELDKVWEQQLKYHNDVLTDEFRGMLAGKGQKATAAIFLARYQIYLAENKGSEKKLQAYRWRAEGLTKELDRGQLAYVITAINNDINKSSGYLGEISDRSKELYFDQITVGQYLWRQISKDPHHRIKGQAFYRQDYLDEFEKIWETQARYHNVLTSELKKQVRDVVIFYQRRLRSQKALISTCELESRERTITVDGKQKVRITGPRVCPRSSPVFQDFRILQVLNNVEVIDKNGGKARLNDEQREVLFQELSVKEKLKKADALKLLYKNHKELDMNYTELEGNRTNAALYKAFETIIDLSGNGEKVFSKRSGEQCKEVAKEVFQAISIDATILEFDACLEGKSFEYQSSYQLWHLLYSYEGDDSKTGDESLLEKLQTKYGIEKAYGKVLAGVTFEQDHASLCTRAIRKILPHLNDGLQYDQACERAGYNHSRSLNEEENEARELKDKLEILPKNALRNPVVEKIINQTIHVVNAAIDTYGKPDEIRLELARELKKNAAERESATRGIAKATAFHEKIRTLLKDKSGDFRLSYVSRNDIIRYKLWKELEPNGHKTLYSNTYIPPGKLFSKEFDIEHIIPRSVLFDDSFSNKTLELRSVNEDKGNMTAFDYVLEEQGEAGLGAYTKRVEDLYKNGAGELPISNTKKKKLLMQLKDLPNDFIERDLRNSQYIAKKTREILLTAFREVNTTTGKITDRLRSDWQLIHVMQELNWDKYNKLEGMTYYETNREGKKLPRIKDWTKRNDHRHHAMDALTVAFTKRSHVQYLNNLNARSDRNGVTYGIEKKELYRDDRGKLLFHPPFPIKEFRATAKEALENILVSFKAKNKVATGNVNKYKVKGGTATQQVPTPRGQLHKETVYGSATHYTTQEVKVGSRLDLATIEQVTKKNHREALLDRLETYGGDPKKAFAGKNAPAKNPIYLNVERGVTLPEKVQFTVPETVYTIRKEVNPDNFKTEKLIGKVVDLGQRKLLLDRLRASGGDPKKAFSNLKEHPIWVNQEKGICIKKVTIKGVSNAEPLHVSKDHHGKPLLDEEGKQIPSDFVSLGNNHHVAIYSDEKGKWHEKVVSFYEAVVRANEGLPAIDTRYNADKGWSFLFTMKQNEMFVFPNPDTDFDPETTDLTDPANNALISANLYRVQKIATRNYMFRHHLETELKDDKQYKGVIYKLISSSNTLKGLKKVRLDHLGAVVGEGEY